MAMSKSEPVKAGKFA